MSRDDQSFEVFEIKVVLTCEFAGQTVLIVKSAVLRAYRPDAAEQFTENHSIMSELLDSHSPAQTANS
jgi:hypothetical protein